jgi:hypothetical protein
MQIGEIQINQNLVGASINDKSSLNTKIYHKNDEDRRSQPPPTPEIDQESDGTGEIERMFAESLSRANK